ncbi:hypothetical protein JZU69_02660, partial [bacterium]|nr:hypothetical protein [bacterium]
MQTGLDFTSGSAVDGIFTVTVIDAYAFTVEVPGSGTGGMVTSRFGVTMTVGTALVRMGDHVYCTPTTGTLPAGEYICRSINSTTAYYIIYPHTAALTAGSTAVLHTLLLTTGGVHGLAIGNRIHVDFTSGGGVDGIYPITAVPSTTTLKINL